MILLSCELMCVRAILNELFFNRQSSQGVVNKLPWECLTLFCLQFAVDLRAAIKSVIPCYHRHLVCGPYTPSFFDKFFLIFHHIQALSPVRMVNF